jgi:segregation and condensation protein B
MPTSVDVLEALLFASDTPLEPERIREVLDLGDADEARGLVRDLTARYESEARSLQIIEVAGGYRMVTRPEMAPWLVRLARARTRVRMSRPALETLAIVAYKQPVSRPEIDVARGVNSEGVLENLLERRLVRIAGRKEAPGRPFLFETTREFLVAFGLRDLGDLPKVEGELVLPDLAAPAPDDGTPDDGTPGEGTPGETEASVTEGGADEHVDTPAEQDPGAGGTDVPAGR